MGSYLEEFSDDFLRPIEDFFEHLQTSKKKTGKSPGKTLKWAHHLTLHHAKMIAGV